MVQGPYLLNGPPETPGTGRKSKGAGKPNDNLAPDKIHLDGKWCGAGLDTQLDDHPRQEVMGSILAIPDARKRAFYPP